MWLSAINNIASSNDSRLSHVKYTINIVEFIKKLYHVYKINVYRLLYVCIKMHLIRKKCYRNKF